LDLISPLTMVSRSKLPASCALDGRIARRTRSQVYLPQLPTRHEIVRRALAMFADTPPMDVIASRAHAAILDAIGARLSAMAAAQ
jgi:hypothetical protein